MHVAAELVLKLAFCLRLYEMRWGGGGVCNALVDDVSALSGSIMLKRLYLWLEREELVWKSLCIVCSVLIFFSRGESMLGYVTTS